MFTLPRLPLLVFTDLDGTLLDHHDYRWGAARPALQRLARSGVPVCPTTSKTLAEVALLNASVFQGPTPCIIENGGALCLPPGYPAVGEATERIHGYDVLRLAGDYQQIRHTLTELRARHGYAFSGFADMDDAKVAELTGLALADAARARQRISSEPLLWQDSDDRLQTFAEQLAERDLRLTRGGRFLHVMGATDKARAMARLCELYREAGLNDFVTVALGDSPNDLEMLNAADIAVAVRRPDGGFLDCRGRQRTLITDAPGPAGWNTAMMQILDDLTHSASATPGQQGDSLMHPTS